MSQKNYFDLNIKILKFSGMWVPSADKPLLYRKLIFIYNFFHIFYPVVFFTILEFLILPTTAKDLNNLMKNLNMAINHFFTGAKIVTWFYYRKDILRIIDILHENSLMYESFEDFNPEDIVKADKKILDRFTLGFGALAGFSAFTALLRCYVILLFDYEDQYIYEVDSFNVTKPIYNQNLPYYSYIFWDHQKNRWNFACAVLFQCYPVFFYGMIVTGFDSLYVGIISKISCQIKILNEAFKTVRPRCLRRLGLPITSSGDVLREVDWVNRELNKELTRNTRSLQIVLSICEKMEEIFTYAVLVQVMVSLLVFCSCLYLISTVNNFIFYFLF